MALAGLSQAGLDHANSIAVELSAYSVKLATVVGDKVVRSDALAGQSQIGNVMYLPDQSKTGKEAAPGEGAWNDHFFAELCGFPNGSHDDLVDAATTAFNKLTGGRRGILDYYAGEVQERILREAREAAAKRVLLESGVVMVTEITDDLGRAFFKSGNMPFDED